MEIRLLFYSSCLESDLEKTLKKGYILTKNDMKELIYLKEFNINVIKLIEKYSDINIIDLNEFIRWYNFDQYGHKFEMLKYIFNKISIKTILLLKFYTFYNLDLKALQFIIYNFKHLDKKIFLDKLNEKNNFKNTLLLEIIFRLRFYVPSLSFDNEIRDIIVFLIREGASYKILLKKDYPLKNLLIIDNINTYKKFVNLHLDTVKEFKYFSPKFIHYNRIYQVRIYLLFSRKLLRDLNIIIIRIITNLNFRKKTIFQKLKHYLI